MTTRLPVSIFFALFTVSGFAGLIYESIWSHYLKLFLGHAAYAQTLVLAIFMGGMALGSWLVSRFTQRIRNLLLGYALAELGIGVFALLFHRIFHLATGWAFDTVLPALGGNGVDLFKWGLASLLILPASILLGTTFPLMSAGIIRLYPDASGRALSMLYFTNSFGAAIGVLASGFFLIDALGLPGTILTAGILNVALALVIWGLARRMNVAAAAPRLLDGAARAAFAPSLARAILLLAFSTGAASFIYEITWIRMLSLALGASTHAFEVMLAAFILAMSLGAWWLRNRIGALKNDLAWLSGLLIAKAFFAACAIWVYGDVLELVRWVMSSTARTDGGYVLTTLAGMVSSMLVMFPAAFCAGMTLPLATRALTSRSFGEGSIGRVYGANTAGCIVGAVFATHVGMELCGVKGLMGIGAALDLCVGVMLLRAATPAVARAPVFAGTAAVLAAGIAVFAFAPLDLLRMSSGIYRHGTFFDPAESRVVFYRDGKTATIAVVDSGPLRSIHTNGKPDAGLVLAPATRASPDEYTMTLLAALPLAMKPEARDVANIGLGSGLTTHTLLGSPNIRVVDTIEIERQMIEGARLFRPRNARAFDDPRSHIYVEDAKTFFAAQGRRYDLIVSEPSNPWVSGTSTLFSEEFYAQSKRYLKDDGLLVQWVQGYEINLPLLATIFRALGSQYRDYAVYRADADLVVIATPGGELPALSERIFSFPELSRELGFLGLQDANDLSGLRVGGRASLEPLFARTGMPANSDFFPILDQRAPRARFKSENAHELLAMRDGLVPTLALLEGETRTSLARLTHVGVNRPQRIDNALFGAEAIGVALTGEVKNAHTLQGAPRASAILVHGLRDACAGAPVDWVNAVSDVARMAIPYLDRHAMAPLFASVHASRCWKTIDEPGRQRLLLLEAINDRDPARIDAAARAVLAAPVEFRRGEFRDVLVSALAAGLAMDRIQEAFALLDAEAGKLTSAERDDLGFQMVVSHLLARAARK
jgi:spermidine synthase